MILLSGATGFLGKAILSQLESSTVRYLTRVPSSQVGNSSIYFDLSKDCEISEDLAGYTVIHCAAKVHAMDCDFQSEYAQINTMGTLNLARESFKAGVKRFIYISSIKVNGECTEPGESFSSSDDHFPSDPYGSSKSDAERGLLNFARETGFEVVIIRPPLVYGPGVKGNFLSLLKLAKLPLPLPFGAISNKRSMVYVENLVDLIITCVDHPDAANKVLLVSDGDDLSLSRLLYLIRKSMGRARMLIPVPTFIFSLVGRAVNKSEVVDRLIGNLQIDSKEAQEALNWKPPYTVEQGIQATVDDFLDRS